MTKITDYHNLYIKLEGYDNKFYITDFDLEAKLTTENTKLRNALVNIIGVIDAWMNEGDYDDIALYEIAKKALED